MSGVEFSINGKQYKVASVDPNTTLNDFIRKHAVLPGTKTMCNEGGCGVCIVSVTAQHPVTNKDETFAVNSCLVPLFSCHRWRVKTIEGIGNRLIGYHPIQVRLASLNGSQCGYCSPGFAMKMYSLLQKNNQGLTMKEIESSFDSNVCRCTGYRSIADAMKTFAKDAPKYHDIEDLSLLNLCKKTGDICTNTCDSIEESFCVIDSEIPMKIFDNISLPSKWFNAYTIKDIFDILKKNGTDSYKLVAGNTAKGVHPIKNRIVDNPKIYINVTSVAELKKYQMDANLIIGANMTITEVINVMNEIADKDIYFSYAKEMAKHLSLVANLAVRNVATIAGNLMIKHKDKRFPSDIFLLLETVGATLTIMQMNSKIKNITLLEFFTVQMNSKIKNITLLEFLQTSMKGNIIYNVNLPPLSDKCCFKSYKIMKRSRNVHALVHAGFLFKINETNKIESVSIVYGGISPEFIHAKATEDFLLGRNIFDKNTLKKAILSLSGEICPDENEIDPSSAYRKKLAIGLFYKCILNFASPKDLNPRHISGGTIFDRPVSSGRQNYEEKKMDWPINQPIQKLEALKQCAGEAVYMDDIPPFPSEIYAAFVLSTVPNGEVENINEKDALSIDGVIAIFKHTEIPGKNSFTPDYPYVFSETEEVLCSGKIKYHGQPIAIVVAEAENIASFAALKVKVTYKNSAKSKPYFKIKDVLADPKAQDRIKNITSYQAESKGDDVKKVITGTFECFGQYHYTMETQICRCVPTESGLDVYSSTQWINWTQKAMSEALVIPSNKININVKRLGGGFGSKISRSIQVAIACGLAAVKLNKPVALKLPLETNMSAIGKRLPCYGNYEVGVDEEGKINYLNHKFYEDVGCSQNENQVVALASEAFSNVYDKTSWTLSSYAVTTNLPSNTWFRGPGTTEGVCMAEHIIDHIATEIKKDPIDVRLKNIKPNNEHIIELISKIRKDSDFDKRMQNVKTFNASNRWKKRGISLMPMRFNIIYYGNLSAFVSIYHGDGTVSISHAGIEFGQGINTKVAQVAAYSLGISVEMIEIKPSSNFITPNTVFDGGSVTSEQCCYAAKKACEIIMDRIMVIKTDNNDIPWKDLIQKAYDAGINLSAHYMQKASEMEGYDVFGVNVAEIEVDVLTGNYQVLRVDILEDSGESVNPAIDIGQAEGGFVQGLGYWTCEELKYSPKTGELLTNRSWNYYTPLMQDIPIDFRVQLLGNISNSLGISRSKTVSEPPLVLAFSIVSALRQAIASARKDGNLSDSWFDLKYPLTPENVLMATEVNIDQFTLK